MKYKEEVIMKQLISAALIFLMLSFFTVVKVISQPGNPNSDLISSFSTDTISSKYFPLQVGNTWVYYVNAFPPLENPIRVTSIERDTIINGHKYFLYQKYLDSQWLRYDSLRGNLLMYSATGSCSDYNNDKIIDSLSSAVGNVILCEHLAIYTRECTSIINQNVFNSMRSVKRFEHDGLVFQTIDYAEGIGIIHLSSGEPPPSNYYELLRGCVINGIVYGDTTLTSILSTGNSVPEKFSLSQNYPNPFNPNTNLEFGIPELGFVSLKVYDVLGNEVATLVNETKPAGTYNYQFSTVNYQLSSGIYFYRLEAGEFSEIKRMILIK